MSTPADPNLGPEREVDLARWRGALLARWWLPVGGAAAGVLIGAVLSLSGGTVFKASVLISPGQAFSPSGAPVLSYNSSPKGINTLLTSEAVLKQAAKAAGIGVGQLRGHVSTAPVSTGAGSAANRGSVLVRITVQLHKAKPAERAANELGRVVIAQSKGDYVKASVDVLEQSITGYVAQLEKLATRIQILNDEIAVKGLDPLTKVVLAGQADNAALRQATISNSLANAQQSLALAKNIEYASRIGPAAQAVQTTARSRRNSIVVGLLIGLILGGIAALIADSRLPRTA